MYDKSDLIFYSLGIVVEDKKIGTNYAILTPIEQLSTADGKLNKTETIATPQGAQLKKRSTIIAKWIQDGDTNRITSPNVYKNETVKIFRFADTDKYYWTTVFHEPLIRRLEEVTYAYSNKKTPLEEYDKNSSYYITYSTLNKFIHLHTSTNDGELSGYDVFINTKTGEISITDTHNNQIYWKSVSKKLIIQNFNEFDIDILKIINIQIGKTLNINVGNNTSFTSPQVVVNANQSIIINTPTYTLNANQLITINTPKYQLNGNLNVNGNIQAQNINANSVNAPNGNVGN